MAGSLINYHRTGTGTPLVLIHGIGATWQCWKPVISRLAEHHDVIAVDLPGFGESVDLQLPEPSLDHMAQSILDLLDHLGIDQFHVSGNSMGGAVSIALLGSGRVLSYNGISSAGMTYGPFIHITKALLKSTYFVTRALQPVQRPVTRLRPLRAALMALMLGRPFHATQETAIDLIDGCARGTAFLPTLRHAIKDGPIPIPETDVPAQMLWGTKDLILPLSALARFAAKWDGLKIVELPGFGHVPMSDGPAQISELIVQFTANAEAANASSGGLNGAKSAAGAR